MVRAVQPGDNVESVIVDGNAVAGLFADIQRSDATLMQLTCGSCGAESVLAEALVELDEVGAIVRCRSCSHTMLTLLRRPDGVAVRIGRFQMVFPVATD
jgi:DNA-directed RNA polymerase subunit RPC12/RpoP